MTESAVRTALQRVTAALPAGEERPGQVEMAEAVARAVDEGRHLVVQAGTGTGKTLAYLVPVILAGQRCVVATATKALQDQLAGKDLPFLAEHLGVDVSYALLKGRSNYVCLQRVAEVGQGADQLALDGLASLAPSDELRRLRRWSEETVTGDRAELDFEPSPAAWAAVSVSSKECPGAARCPKGEVCFAERARQTAAESSVVVVNTHLYGLHLESGGVILPEHEVVVIDEAHQLEDTISATFGVELGPSRFASLARSVRSILEAPEMIDGIEMSGTNLARALAPEVGRRLKGRLPTDIADALAIASGRLERVQGALGAIDDSGSEDVKTRKQRAVKSTGVLSDEIAYALEPRSGSVTWVEGPEMAPSLRVAPIDVAPDLQATLWSKTTAVLTSATIGPSLPTRLGLEGPAVDDIELRPFDQLDVGSPFDYEANALLYCAAHLPDPRAAGHEVELHDELEALITAAQGRTLALFTSYRAMDAALEELRRRLPWPVLGQRDLPKPALVERFTNEEETSLFATMGFWQGIDVPGPSLSLVTLDRLPFPRPDEPLLEARRERARADAFRLVDLPRAVTLLAQGAGRLIRTASDRGVVAVLDSRLATNARYRWDIVRALPPMRRTRDRKEVEEFLTSLRAGRQSEQ
jgi:ATP-dependent DNA helicase DinG